LPRGSQQAVYSHQRPSEPPLTNQNFAPVK
jgi:hypothetical protein